MATIRALLVLALLAVPSMPASAGLADPDSGWGDNGAVTLADGYLPRWIMVDADGTTWVVGFDTDPRLIPTFLVRISPDGSDVADIALEIPDSYEAHRVVRTPSGFAFVFFDDADNLVLAAVGENGELDPDFGTQNLGTASSIGVSTIHPIGDRLLVGGVTEDDATGDRHATIRMYRGNGQLDTRFGTGGVVTMTTPCFSVVEVLFRTVSGFDAVWETCGVGPNALTVSSFDLAGILSTQHEFRPDPLELGRLEGAELPDGRRILHRVGLSDDFDTESHLQIMTLGATSLAERTVDHPELRNRAAVVVADRRGGAWAYADLGEQTLVVDVSDPGPAPLVAGNEPPRAGTTQWTTGAIFLGYDDGTITRSAPDGSGLFTDDDGSVHESDIAELAASDITRGCNPPLSTRFCPDDAVTRGEMAAFLARALDLPAGEASFSDVAGSVFSADIAALAASGITKGCTADRFCPDDPVTRGQMAAFLTRALRLDPGPDAFTDDVGDIFEGDINALAAAGITRGCTVESFCPEEQVTRAQMATFLVRAGLAD